MTHRTLKCFIAGVLLIRSVILLFILLFATNSHSKLLRILHTNDLHSIAKGSRENGRGGYAQLKFILDQEKKKSEDEGIPVVQLDAGDFFEGGIYYFSDQGKDSMRLMNSMGYDAVALGNHDFQMGLFELNDILKAVPPKFKFLSSNLSFSPRFKGIHDHLNSFTVLKKGDVKIAVLGLTTDEVLYKWQTDLGSPDSSNGNILSIDKRMRFLRQQIRKKGADITIALTHLGVEADKKFISGLWGIDLVVGGHSHTTLPLPVVQEDQYGQAVPIVQTGSFGENLGSMLVDIQKNKPARVVDYKLIPILVQGEKDTTLARMIDVVEEKVQAFFGFEKLNEILGQTKVKLFTTNYGPSVFGQFSARAFKHAVGAEIGVDVSAFQGLSQPAGDLTLRSFIELYPRVFDFKTFNQEGNLKVWKASVPGFAILFGLKQKPTSDFALSFSGLSYRFDQGRISNVTVHGNRLSPFKDYSVAIPEPLIKGGFGVSSLTKIIFQNAKKSSVTVWEALQDELKSENRVIDEEPIPDPKLGICENDLDEKIEKEINEAILNYRHRSR